ncbi:MULTISPECIES: helix-turn-helix transcriptional regulator [unclassified Caballeronia]|jgi:predicted DNA-binding transcriptional regulator AlpA|uniref:helix-turn-helix transcriptional regulator n=1 Tax=unclassified Caballeronia TaxID=2646786 RepID=UPI003ECECB00
MFQSDGGGSCGQASARSTATSEAADEKAADDDGSDGDSEGEPERRRHSYIPGKRLLRLPQDLDMIGFSKPMVHKMMNLERFRNRGKYTTLQFWVESEVQNWIKEIVTP